MHRRGTGRTAEGGNPRRPGPAAGGGLRGGHCRGQAALAVDMTAMEPPTTPTGVVTMVGWSMRTRPTRPGPGGLRSKRDHSGVPDRATGADRRLLHRVRRGRRVGSCDGRPRRRRSAHQRRRGVGASCSCPPPAGSRCRRTPRPGWPASPSWSAPRSRTPGPGGAARLAEEQAALRRVATLVARGAPAQEVFAAVTARSGSCWMRLHPDEPRTTPTGWSRSLASGPGQAGAAPVRVGAHLLRRPQRDPQVLEDGRAARIDHYGPDAGAGPAPFVAAGIRSAAGAPINVEGRLWGVMMVASSPEPPAGGHRGAPRRLHRARRHRDRERREPRGARASRARIVAAADQTRRASSAICTTAPSSGSSRSRSQLRAVQAPVPPELAELAARARPAGRRARPTCSTSCARSRAGIHPAILSQGGLGPALEALARRSAVPVRPRRRIDGRLPEPVEVAAYYVVSEALTNAAKHADASAVDVAVDARPTGTACCGCRCRTTGVGGAEFGARIGPGRASRTAWRPSAAVSPCRARRAAAPRLDVTSAIRLPPVPDEVAADGVSGCRGTRARPARGGGRRRSRGSAAS